MVGWSLVGTGAPNTASISSPMNCKTRPWWLRIAAVHLREVRVQGLHDVGRRGRLHPRGEVAQVREEDGDVQRLAAEATRPARISSRISRET
jgi:hypothetical protein